jgi:hypothetical protein
MKGFIKKAAALACFGATLFTVVGCAAYHDAVDPCWPERYNFMSRSSVREMSIAQSDMGHKLDQTIWDHHFDPGTDRLNPAGRDHLLYLSRRMPVPDYQLWLQFPHDVNKDRDALIAKRKDAIRAFLTTQTLANNGGAYQIAIHDHAVPMYKAGGRAEEMNLRPETNLPADLTVEMLKGRQWPFEEKEFKVQK